MYQRLLVLELCDEEYEALLRSTLPRDTVRLLRSLPRMCRRDRCLLCDLPTLGGVKPTTCASYRTWLQSQVGSGVIEAVDRATDLLGEGPDHARVYTAVIQTPCGIVGIAESSQQRRAMDQALGDTLRQHQRRQITASASETEA